METEEYDFSQNEMNKFFYTPDKQINKLDDLFILSQITAKYPDFNQKVSDNILKQVIICIVSDNKLIEELQKKYDINVFEIFKIIYRNYEHIFNKCFITKIQKIIKTKKYARKISRH